MAPSLAKVRGTQAGQTRKNACLTIPVGCELVIAWAEPQLAQNSTESQIEAFLDNLCNDIPSPVSAEVNFSYCYHFQHTLLSANEFSSYLLLQCENLVQYYTPELIQILESYESPQTACTQLHLCQS